ncbi:M23 family metallopeptidase [Micromonospora cathayae]|uniref:M23 family metallopeptidase n=1 Tax=Micromonospora cathayae TaxID=3028804 RepID=A0ABY7ZYW5_9ACTN|nr:M23 family metallopeptidase [Micromonospora sp. HUAS 3]WDZ88264.1 M23 family metallopeptidase [Micromonospora sp. HUAS 3]
MATSRVVRHRRSRRPRTRYLVTGAAALVGLGLAGVTAVVTNHDDSPAPATVTVDAEARAEAAARADRADRPPASAPATATTPAPSPTSTTPAPASPTAKPKATRKPVTTPKPTRTATSKPKAAWVDPMPGAAVTSCYGPRWGVLHAGIDLALPAGTPVRAAAAGTVVKAGDAGDGYGISVFVDHGSHLTHYAHLSAATVSVGAKVAAGTTIGREGSTGDSTGPHLHFEVHQGGMWNQIDPAPFMRARGVDLGC